MLNVYCGCNRTPVKKRIEELVPSQFFLLEEGANPNAIGRTRAGGGPPPSAKGVWFCGSYWVSYLVSYLVRPHQRI